MGALLRSSEFSVKNLDGVIDNHGIAALLDPERTFFQKSTTVNPIRKIQLIWIWRKTIVAINT